MTLEYVHAKGLSLEEMRRNFRESELYKRGDARLVWVNEGDLFLMDFHAKLSAEQEPLGVDIGDTSELYEP